MFILFLNVKHQLIGQWRQIFHAGDQANERIFSTAGLSPMRTAAQTSAYLTVLPEFWALDSISFSVEIFCLRLLFSFSSPEYLMAFW